MSDDPESDMEIIKLGVKHGYNPVHDVAAAFEAATEKQDLEADQVLIDEAFAATRYLTRLGYTFGENDAGEASI